MKYLVIILMIFVSPFASFGQDEDKPKKTESPRGDDIPIGSFTGGLVVGLNAAQIDGDALYGYNKLALLAGAQVGYRLSEKWMPTVGILYNRKGSRSELVLSGSFFESNYSLDYIDVPVTMNFIDGGVRISGGLSYSRLIDGNIIINDIDETDDRLPYYRNNNLNILLGFGYFISEHWGFDFRWTYSLFSIVDLDVGNIINRPQVHNYLSFRTIYQF